jgi:hypothetical protein
LGKRKRDRRCTAGDELTIMVSVTLLTGRRGKVGLSVARWVSWDEVLLGSIKKVAHT